MCFVQGLCYRLVIDGRVPEPEFRILSSVSGVFHDIVETNPVCEPHYGVFCVSPIPF